MQVAGASQWRATSRTASRTAASSARSAGISMRLWTSTIDRSDRSGDPGVVGGRTLDELPVALLTGEPAVADDDAAAGEDDVARAGHLASLVARIVDVHVVGLRRDRPRALRVVDDQVRIRTDGDGALARVHPEQ